ncbi:MAG: ATP-dependent helicase [Gammaproteobacteria bacterium]|nr:ATP-dependent helicase [Gammaproteobacteria bacterium]
MRLHDDTLVIVGPPGTGKTTRLMGEVERALAEGIPPERIAYLAFTRKASRESVERAVKQFEIDPKALENFRTLHSLAYHELGLSASDVVNNSALKEFGDLVGLSFSATANHDEERMEYGNKSHDLLLELDQSSRIRRMPLRLIRNLMDADVLVAELERCATAYAEFKQSRSLLDFTDMLEQFLLSPETPAYDLLLIDEGQDLSPLQWEVVRKLAGNSRRLVVAGDDDQAIFGWAGADVDSFIHLEGRVEVLGQSYRVPRLVQRIANGIIEAVQNRRPKAWKSRLGAEGEVHWASSDAEVDLNQGEWLILARNHYVTNELTASLFASGIPYERNGKSPIAASLSQALADWKRICGGGSISYTAASGIYAYMKAGGSVARGGKAGLAAMADSDDKVTLADLQAAHQLQIEGVGWQHAFDRLDPADRSFIQRAEESGAAISAPRIRISTIHGAKGGEAENVLLFTDMARRTYDSSLSEPDDERRVFYVGATRAKESLVVVRPRTPLHFKI